QALESEYVLTGRYLLLIEVVAEMEGLGFTERAIARRLQRLFARRDRHLRRAARLLRDVRARSWVGLIGPRWAGRGTYHTGGESTPSPRFGAATVAAPLS